MAAILLSLLLLALCSLIVHRIMTRAVDSREPPYVYPKIPLLGHFLGLLRRGPDYLIEICPEDHPGIYTIPLFSNRVIVVEGAEEVDAIRKAKGNNLSLSVVLAIALGKVFGVSPSCQAKFTPDPKTLKENSLKTETDRLFMKLTRTQMLEDAKTRLEKELVETLRETPSQMKVSIFSFLEKRLRNETARTILGNEIKSNFVERLGDFENGMEKLMLPFPGIFARRELHLRELAADIREYIQKEHFTEGSESIKELVGVCRAQNLELEDTARLFLLVMIAFVGNLSNVGSWTACWVSLCPSRLSLIREEILADDSHLDPSGTKSRSALLESTLIESLRRTQGSFTFRMVMEDLELATAKGHRYLLPKDSLIVMAPRQNMTSEKIWDQPYEFSPARFENHKLFAVQHRHSDKTAASQDGLREKYKRDRNYPQELTEDQKLSFQPFGAGKDKCKGHRLAKNTIMLFVEFFVMNFDIFLDPEETYSTLVPTTRCLKFRNPPINDTKVILRQREGSVIATRRENAVG